MKGLLIHKPILKGIIDHAEINLFAQIMWMSRSVMKSFDAYKNVLCILLICSKSIKYGRIYNLDKLVILQSTVFKRGGFYWELLCLD